MRRLRRFLLAGVLLLATGAGAWGYALLGSKWTSSQIVMHLQLGSSGGPLIDGAASWNDVAEDALATWNQYISATQFTVVRNSTVTPGDGDNVNNVFFDSTVYGDSFGGAVAITTGWTVNGGRRRIEADTVFNSNLDWNSYRGDLRNSVGGDTLYDLRRVALHEFGHTLGLDHPDEAGQSVDAIMNSHVSDVDHLLRDDIRGAQALYGSGVGGTRASFTRPSSSGVTTFATSYVFRGKADIGQVDAVYLVNTRLGTRRFYKAQGVSKWQRSLPLRSGSNTIRLYVKTAAGPRVKVAQRTVVRASP